MYEPTTVSRETLIEAVEAASAIYAQSLLRQFGVTPEEDDQSRILRPSQLGKPAMETIAKKFFPERFDNSSEFGLQTRQLFHEGDTLEGDVLFHLIRTGVKILEIQPYIEWFGIHGHGDFIIERNGKPLILECKSAKDSYFKDVNRNGLNDDRGYLTQLAIYQDALNMEAEWLVYNKDNSSCVYITPPATDCAQMLTRAKRVVTVYNEIERWEDAFKHFRPTPPKKEYANKKWTGRYMLPLTMWFSPVADLIYDLYEDENAKGEKRRYVADYLYPDEYSHLKPHLE